MLRVAALLEDKSKIVAVRSRCWQRLVKERGAAAGYAPLRSLLEKGEKAWLEIFESPRSARTSERGRRARAGARRRARHRGGARARGRRRTHGASVPRLVEARPEDVEGRRRLLSLLRESGRRRSSPIASRARRGFGDPEDDDEVQRELWGSSRPSSCTSRAQARQARRRGALSRADRAASRIGPTRLLELSGRATTSGGYRGVPPCGGARRTAPAVARGVRALPSRRGHR